MIMRRGFAFLALAILLTPLTALAGSYPEKSITIVCPYSAGGGGDTSTRMIAKLAGDIMGVKINVENKTGGGATIGIGVVSKAKPDGYTIGFVSTSPITIRTHMMKAPYHPLKDLSYIGQFVASSQPLVVLKDSPHKTLADLIAYAKANPGKLRWSTSVQRGGPHVAVEAMFKQEGAKATFIPFKGGSKVLAALLGGTIDAAMISEGNKATL
ncbi:MAG: tripartite tricarboxylate transporter substrate binding protein, partial [Chloroflexi bacterium]